MILLKDIIDDIVNNEQISKKWVNNLLFKILRGLGMGNEYESGFKRISYQSKRK